jgi:hypothetical protein
LADFRTIDNGIPNFGTFDNNYYCRPIDDDATIYAEYTGNLGTISNFMNLATWQSTFNYDLNSKKSPYPISAYKITDLIGTSKVENGKFNTDITSWSQSSNYNNGHITWDNTNKIDGGSLKLSFSASSGKPDGSLVAHGSCGEVVAGETYILKFSLIASSPGKLLKISIRKDSPPYNYLTPMQYISADANRKEFELLFTPDLTETNARIDYEIKEDLGPIWIDNVELYKATIQNANLEDSILFVYNPKSTNQTLNIGKNYIDVKGTKYSGSIILLPYTSAVLVVDSDSYFTITKATVNYPSASGITWNTGFTPTITWSGFPGSSVKIELYKGGLWYSTIISSTPNDGGYHSWTVPTSTPAGADYRIKITSTASAAIYDYSNYYFTIAGGDMVGPKTLGNTTVYSLINSTANYRRALPLTFTEPGTVQSISIHHNGGTGQVLLGVYSDASGTPSSRLGVTPSTTINSAAGWQTVALTSPVTVASGQTVWLSWVFQTNPGVRFTTGTPAIAQSSASWSGGMPAAYGTVATTKNLKFSIYCTYTTSGAKSEGSSPDIISVKPDNEIVTVDPNQTDGNKEKVLIYPNPTERSVIVTWDNYYDSRLILTIYNLQGTPVKEVQIETEINEITVDLDDIKDGMYLFELKETKNGLIINRSRIVKY